MSASSSLRLSVLDLSPIPSGSSSAQALQNSLDLARWTDQLGYYRYWLSEHHNTGLLASAAPEIMIGQVAAATSKIRVGSGGVMLPNHPPLRVAEIFRLLEALFPGRIDLGLGRAPGTDGRTALALRRSREAIIANDFPEQLAELMGFFSGRFPEGYPFRNIVAIPTDVPTPPVWLLGSSDFSAQLAAQQGLGFAFAHHISPTPAIPAMQMYYEQFQPSEYLQEPLALVGISVICAPTDEEAHILASSSDLTLLRFHQNVRAPVPSVEEAMSYEYTDYEAAVIRANRDRLFVGSPSTVREQLLRLAEQTRVNELMVTTLIHDHSARKRSYELLAQAFGIS